MQIDVKTSYMTVLSIFVHCETVRKLWELDVLVNHNPSRR